MAAVFALNQPFSLQYKIVIIMKTFFSLLVILALNPLKLHLITKYLNQITLFQILKVIYLN